MFTRYWIYKISRDQRDDRQNSQVESCYCSRSPSEESPRLRKYYTVWDSLENTGLEPRAAARVYSLGEHPSCGNLNTLK